MQQAISTGSAIHAGHVHYGGGKHLAKSREPHAIVIASIRGPAGLAVNLKLGNACNSMQNIGGESKVRGFNLL